MKTKSIIAIAVFSLFGILAGCSIQKSIIPTTNDSKNEVNFNPYNGESALKQLEPLLSKYNRVSNVIAWTIHQTTWFNQFDQTNGIEITYKINKTNLQSDLNFAAKFNITLLSYMKDINFPYKGVIIKTTYNTYNTEEAEIMQNPNIKGDILTISISEFKKFDYTKVTNLNELTKLSIPIHTFIAKKL